MRSHALFLKSVAGLVPINQSKLQLATSLRTDSDSHIWYINTAMTIILNTYGMLYRRTTVYNISRRRGEITTRSGPLG